MNAFALIPVDRLERLEKRASRAANCPHSGVFGSVDQIRSRCEDLIRSEGGSSDFSTVCACVCLL